MKGYGRAIPFLAFIPATKVCAQRLFFYLWYIEFIEMKRLFLLFLFPVVFFGCKKDNDAIDHGYCKNYAASNSSGSNTGGPFSFTDIEINPNPVHKGTVAKVIAKATGSNLTFKWSTPHGDLFGTGGAIYYSDSCLGTFQITCTVSDGTNTATITVPVNIIN